MPDYSKDFWKILFEKYYHDDILHLADRYPERRALIVDFTVLNTAWGSIGETSESAVEFLVHNPEQAFQDANEALRSFSLSNIAPEGWEKGAYVELSGFKPGLS